MKSCFRTKPAAWLAAAGLALLLVSCRHQAPAAWQGYFEGEFVYVSAPLAGRLESLDVARGDRVEAGAPLFTLEHAAELAAQRQAADQLRVAASQLADLRKGARPTEVAALEARLQQARTAAELSGRELARQSQLQAANASSAEAFDRARLTDEQNRHAVDELAAQVETARLGGRTDAVAAAEAAVASARAALDRATWSVDQKTQAAPQAALVYDTLYRPGELVPAANPVVALLPPANLKVRFFVPEDQLGALRAGEAVHIHLDGREAAIDGRISYISPQPEYTPPVLYNRDNRAKLSFMIEASVAPADARNLHPGQPVDVRPAE